MVLLDKVHRIKVDQHFLVRSPFDSIIVSNLGLLWWHALICLESFLEIIQHEQNDQSKEYRRWICGTNDGDDVQITV